MQATVILVHGAFHGAWCWQAVVEGLVERGIGAHAIDLPGRGASQEPLGGFDEDVAAVRSLLRTLSGRVVLCGHSYGGAVISEAVDSEHPADHLVFVAALMPDRSEGISDIAPDPGDAPIMAALVAHDDHSAIVDPARAADLFYHDCSDDTAIEAASRLGAHALSSLTARASRAAWRDVESTYVICEADRAIAPRTQERLAKRSQRVVRWPTSHSPMLSQPARLVELLADLAD